MLPKRSGNSQMTRFILFILQAIAIADKPLQQDEDSAESSSRTKEPETRQDNPVSDALWKMKEELKKGNAKLTRAMSDLKKDIGRKIEEVKAQMVDLEHPNLPSDICKYGQETWKKKYPCRKFFQSKDNHTVVHLRYGCLMDKKQCWRQRSVKSKDWCYGKVEGTVQNCKRTFQPSPNSLCNRLDLVCD